MEMYTHAQEHMSMCLYLGESKLFIVLSMQLLFMILISTQPIHS